MKIANPKLKSQRHCGHGQNDEPLIEHSMQLALRSDPASEIAHVRAWLDLPRTLFERAERCRIKGTMSRTSIDDIEIAIVVAISRVSALRFRELLALRHRGRDRDITIPRQAGRCGRLHMHLTNSKTTRQVQLDKETTRILQIYLRHYRPEAAKPVGNRETQLLFPGRRAEGDPVVPRNTAALRRAFDQRMREAGLRMRPCELRHVSARLILPFDRTVLLPALHQCPQRHSQFYAVYSRKKPT